MKTILSTIVWSLFLWTIWEWEFQNAERFAISLVPLFTLSTVYFEWIKFKNYPRTSNRFSAYNDSSRRCPCNGYLFPLVLRIAAMLLANVQVLVTMQLHVWNEVSENFEQYCVYAAVASMLYVVSGIVQTFALCQCATEFNPSEKIKILFWGLHDIVLGSIWVALAFQFHDIVDDSDDTHWRSLFSSMIIFHILSILFDIWNNDKYNIDWFHPGFRICSRETEASMMMLIRFVLYCVIYFWILMRLHSHDSMLIKMGWNDWAALNITISVIIIVCINILERIPRKSKTESMDRLLSLNF